MMKRTFLRTVLVLAMIAALMVTAAAVGEDMGVSPISALSVTVGSETYVGTNGSHLTVELPADTPVSACTVNLTTDSAASVSVTATPGDDQLYVAEVGNNTFRVNFNISTEDLDLSQESYGLTFTTENGTTWIGTFGTGYSEMTVGMLASVLSGRVVTIPDGAISASSPAQSLVVNSDLNNVSVMLCAPGATVCTVTYVVGDNQNTWLLPAGITLPLPTMTSVELLGWYVDPGFTTVLPENTTVTGDMTVYGKQSGDIENFIESLKSTSVTTISNLTEWELFVTNASQAPEDKLVVLGDNIDCLNATYDPIDFKGNFDGCNFSISNAKFRSVLSGYYSSNEEDIYCSGLFEAIGPGQIIANLKLNNITAQYSATYAGILAGLADGASNDRALIQNVQVTGGSASGRTAAGVVGFIRNTTVRYCSSTGTTISGLANGGGIVGINNSKVEFCYSTTSPTALPSLFGGSTGGIVAKKVRGGWAEGCWATTPPVGASDSGGTDVTVEEVSSTTDYMSMVLLGFTQPCWAQSTVLPLQFNSTVEYTFS